MAMELPADSRILNQKRTRYRVADLIVDISGDPLPGVFTDWPSEVQDGVLAALARQSMRARKDFQIVHSYSDKDYDTGVAYIHVTAVAMETLQ